MKIPLLSGREDHRGQFLISSVMKGNPDIFSQEQKETINAVLDYYGKQSSKKTKV